MLLEEEGMKKDHQLSGRSPCTERLMLQRIVLPQLIRWVVSLSFTLLLRNEISNLQCAFLTLLIPKR